MNSSAAVIGLELEGQLHRLAAYLRRHCRLLLLLIVGTPINSRFIEGLQGALQNSFAKLFAGFEVWNVLARNTYRLPGAWISSASRLVIHQIETTKSPDFYALT